MKKYIIQQRIGLFDRARLVVEGKIVGKPGNRILKIKNIVSGKQLGFVTKTNWVDFKLFKLPFSSEDIDWIDIEQETIDKMNNMIPELKEFVINDLEIIEEME